MTFPVRLQDHASNANFPLDGEPLDFTSLIFPSDNTKNAEKNKDFTRYDEGIYVGYRHFDKNNLEVSYPFGFGLSYTRFEYSNDQVTVKNDTVHVALTVKNGGDLAGKEVVQVYVSKTNSTIDRPVQELKTFVKTPLLAPGASATLYLQIPVSELWYWNEQGAAWKLEKGGYVVKAGASSRDIKVSREIQL